MTAKKKTKSVRMSGTGKRHFCAVHGRPIRLDRWRSGHRTTGCADCYRTRKIPPPKKRMCKEHKRPILRQRWWSGYRTKGCVRCFEVPPPEDRLCRKHDRPIQPSGLEVATRPAATSVSIVVLAMPQHKLGIERDYGCSFSKPNDESASSSVASPKSNPSLVQV
jgi:hypothetical protein